MRASLHRWPRYKLPGHGSTLFPAVLLFVVLGVCGRGQPQAQGKVYVNQKFGYQVSYPANWFPSGNTYANAFEIRNYDPQNPASVAESNRASLTIVDVVNDSAEITSRFLDSLAASGQSPPRSRAQRAAQTLTIDGHRAVRVERKAPGQQLGHGAAGALGGPVGPPPAFFYLSTYVADGKHLLSLEAAAPAGADASVISDIRSIEDSVKFNAAAQPQKGEAGHERQ